MCAVHLSPSLEGVVFTVVSKRRGMCWTEVPGRVLYVELHTSGFGRAHLYWCLSVDPAPLPAPRPIAMNEFT